MKYYIYISDAKVDMLLEQIPHEEKIKAVREHGFDIKLFKASWRSEENVEMGRVSRLEVVLDFKHKYGNVGTIDKPDEYIYDTAKMRYASVYHESLAYFTGMTKRTAFGLNGSAEHMIGNRAGDGKPEVFRSLSGIGPIVQWLKEEGSKYDESESGVFFGVKELATAAVMDKDPMQTLEFFAKRLLFAQKYKNRPTDKNVQVLLASPLYVAMTD